MFTTRRFQILCFVVYTNLVRIRFIKGLKLKKQKQNKNQQGDVLRKLPKKQTNNGPEPIDTTFGRPSDLLLCPPFKNLSNRSKTFTVDPILYISFRMI